MHAEWLCKLASDQLSGHPEWVIERYFLSSGQIDQTKTTTVVGIPFPRYSDYRTSQMREAASKVTGLHQATGRGPETQTIFMGWDSEAVDNAAESHAAQEMEEVQAAEKEREGERAELHTGYLNSLKRKKGPKTYSPIGSYIVDCKEIEGGWSDQVGDLSIDIRQTNKPVVFEASFDFGILEGIMIISTKTDALEQYCAQLDREAESEGEMLDWSEDEDEDREKIKVDNNKKLTAGFKRKAKALKGPPPKKSKAQAAQSRTFLLKLKCRETGEGEIQYMPEEGTIKFKDDNFASFTGEANLSFVGRKVPFTARKVSNTPAGYGNSWAEYSESAHEYARVSRWR